MRCLLFTSDDPLYMPLYLAPVVERYADEIVEIVNAPHQETGIFAMARERYEMLGASAFLQIGVRYGRGKLLDAVSKIIGSHHLDRYYSVATLAKEYDVAYRTVDDVNATLFLDHVNALNPDILLSIGCGQFLGEQLLAIPRHGGVNLHGSLLPDYRGRATAFWVLYHNEDESGVTAHYMNDQFDGGDIIDQRRFPIEESDSMHDVYEKIIKHGSQLAIELLEAFPDLPTRSNPTARGSYYSLPDARARDEFLSRGNRFI